MDPRLDSIYNVFDQICSNNQTKFNREEFDNCITHELATHSLIPPGLNPTAALDLICNKHNIPHEDIANYIFDTMSNTATTTIPNWFKFNNSKQCCLAPYSTINFDTLGAIRVCCYNNKFNLGTYPDVTIEQAWQNEEREKFIEKLKRFDFGGGCEKCNMLVQANNTAGALFTKFDKFDGVVSDNNMPVNFEFEFGTVCNYECIMCGGKWSSSIRKNREKLPPIKTPYDDAFVEQLKPFVSHMRVANFLGGEPFLTPLYYKIWDLMYEHNPTLPIYITSNGSILNDRVKEYLGKLPKAMVVVSLDSLKAETYEIIRKNGNFDQVIKNIEELMVMKKLAGIAFCPLIQNVNELPSIVEFCIKHNVDLSINTVTGPLGGAIKGIHQNEEYNTIVWTGDTRPSVETIAHKNTELIMECCLHTLPKADLLRVVRHLSSYNFQSSPAINKRYVDFIAYVGNLI